jgi:hypothetical protein
MTIVFAVIGIAAIGLGVFGIIKVVQNKKLAEATSRN